MKCDCPTDRNKWLRVGKAIKVRNRLQVQAFPAPSPWPGAGNPSPWVLEPMTYPHCHIPQIAVWYVEKSTIGAAEAVLIDLLKPSYNLKDCGYGDPELWVPRAPDIVVTIESFEPRSKDPDHRKEIEEFPRIHNLPGVYAWFVDAGDELPGLYSMLPIIQRSCPEEAIRVEQEFLVRKAVRSFHPEITDAVISTDEAP